MLVSQWVCWASAVSALSACRMQCAVWRYYSWSRPAQVLELMELAPLRSALVGVPGVSGLSVEQRKRLTIGVELVANPSVIFMVGLDSL